MGPRGSQHCAPLRLSRAQPRAAGGAGLCQCCSRCSRLRPALLSRPVNIYDPFTRFFLPSCERFAAFSCWKESELLLGAVARKTKGAFLELSSTHSSWLWLLCFLTVPALQQQCVWSCWLQGALLSSGVLQQSAAHGRSAGGGWWSRSAPEQESMLSIGHLASHRALRPQGACEGSLRFSCCSLEVRAAEMQLSVGLSCVLQAGLAS